MANGTLDSSYWAYDLGNGDPTNPGWGNAEVEYYTNNSANISIYDGLLTITARQQNYGSQQYTSARIKTDGNIDFEYGKLDVIAKLPSGDGTWPAIWLLPQNNIYYYNSSDSDSLQYLNDGEIDVMEAVGGQPGLVTSSAQSRNYNQFLNDERIATDTVPDDTTTFHDYGLTWTPHQLLFTIDGVTYHTVNRASTDTYKEWPYDQPYYLIINLALGGTYGGINNIQYPPDGIDNASLPATLQIRSITYSKYTGTSSD
jgi:beta-glucanase (GH16 family)